jgi:hypothetical protein
MSILQIQFPGDFEERHRKYKAVLETGQPEPEEIVALDEVEEPVSETTETEVKPKTEIGKDGTGYLLFHDHRIPIGESSSGKFRLVETLCGVSFGVAKTIETVFSSTESIKDKNKVDASLGDPYMAGSRKFALLENQVKEVNRAITEYSKQKKLKNFESRLTLKTDSKTHPKKVWLEERVGRRG